MSDKRNILVVGGAGYVGAILVPKLLDEGHTVSVLDLYLYGHDIFEGYANHPNLVQIQGDMRHEVAVKKALAGCDSVIHLACISNDPSFELDPALGKSINLDAFGPLVKASKAAGVNRFIYASSSSVYGIKEGVEVTEDLELEPLTDYSKFKVRTEEILEEERGPGFTTCIVRPATVCGYSPRQRLDVIVNILTTHAVTNRKIKVLGGSQLRPNIHIQDMADLYVRLMELPDEKIDGGVYNGGYYNDTVLNIAQTVKRVVEEYKELGESEIELEILPTNDNRSYHVSSAKLQNELGFHPQYTIEDAVRGLVEAFMAGKLPNAMDDIRYYNIKTMQAIALK